MAQSQDFTAMFQDMFKAFPMDAQAFQDGMKDTAAMGEKFAAVALEAASKSTDVSSKWAKDTLEKMSGLATVGVDPADMSKAVTEFASTSAETATSHMAAFAEIAKQVQLDTVELMMAAAPEAKEKPAAKPAKKSAA